MKKKIKDLTVEEVKEICKQTRMAKNGKERKYCVNNCPLNSFSEVIGLFDNPSIRMCELIIKMNEEVDVNEKQN